MLVQFAYERVFEDRLRGESIRFIGMMLPEYLAHERVLGDHPKGECSKLVGVVLPEYLAHERVLGDHPKGMCKPDGIANQDFFCLLM